MDEKPEQFVPLRLEVLINGKRRAMLGVQLGHSLRTGLSSFR